jgi:hypothetical protein
MTESTIQRAILERIGARRDVRLWRNNTGTAVPMHVVSTALALLTTGRVAQAVNLLRSATPIRFGLVGSADLLGIIKPSGKFLAVEVKSATGRVSEQQQRFLDMVRDFGGVAVVARSVDDVERAIEAAL